MFQGESRYMIREINDAFLKVNAHKIIYSPSWYEIPTSMILFCRKFIIHLFVRSRVNDISLKILFVSIC